jgi:5-methyltetrahydropteroyltriglutamate--homocysteine methyltransferase
MPPRTHMRELWRVAPEWLEQAQDDAVIVVVREQEAAGIDIVSDGEIRRESYSNLFANALEGVDLDNPGQKLSRTGTLVPVPRVTGKVHRKHAVNVRDLKFLKAHTDRLVKTTLPGPFTMTQLTVNNYYKSEADLAMDYAVAVNEEMKDLFAAGADVVQIDEPYLQAQATKAREYALPALERAFKGVQGATALHTCFGYAALVNERPQGYSFLRELNQCPVSQISIETAQVSLDCSILEGLRGKKIMLGVLDLSSQVVETPEAVAERIRRALPYVDAADIILAPDCGMKYLPRAVASGKLRAMADGAAIVRAELQK